VAVDDNELKMWGLFWFNLFEPEDSELLNPKPAIVNMLSQFHPLPHPRSVLP
jgi:hypothetical protein